MDINNLFKRSFPKLADKFDLTELQEKVIKQVIMKKTHYALCQPVEVNL